MRQASLFSGLPPFEKGSQTSKAAAVSMLPHTKTLQAKVLKYIYNYGPVTDEDIEAALFLRHQTASARRRELQLRGLIVQSGTRRNQSGRMAAAWVRK